MRNLFVATMIAAAASGSAIAACAHNGVYYEHGAVLCFDGYLQECTVADYWKAIGTCNAAEPRQELAERLIGTVLGDQARPGATKTAGDTMTVLR